MNSSRIVYGALELSSPFPSSYKHKCIMKMISYHFHSIYTHKTLIASQTMNIESLKFFIDYWWLLNFVVSSLSCVSSLKLFRVTSWWKYKLECHNLGKNHYLKKNCSKWKKKKNIFYVFYLQWNQDSNYHSDYNAYFITCFLPCGETKLLLFSPRFCFLHTEINGLINED